MHITMIDVKFRVWEYSWTYNGICEFFSEMNCVGNEPFPPKDVLNISMKCESFISGRMHHLAFT